jgi:ketosteroid isomerase-like protein
MAGDHQVAAEVAVEFEVLATGRRYRDEELHLWTFDGAGKVTRLRHYLDSAKHVAAAQG